MIKYNKKLLLSGILFVITIILMILGFTYAFFSTTIFGNQNAKQTVITTADLKLVFIDTQMLSTANMLPGQTISKTFTVENTGTNVVDYEINVVDVINEFTNNELVYSITSTNNGGTIEEALVPTTNSLLMISTIEPNVVQEFTITLKFKETGENQNINQGAVFNGKLQINSIVNNIIDTAMYSWDTVYLESMYINDVYQILNDLKVKKIYHSFSDLTDVNITQKVIDLTNNEFEVYYLTGDPSWWNKPASINSKIDMINTYNVNNPDNKIKGIVLDVEFYTLDEWDDTPQVMIETLTDTYQEVKLYANNLEIEVIFCIPYWLDSSYEENLEELISISDRISVMNYNRNILIKGIEKEVQIAKTYNKEVENISEFKISSPSEEFLTFHDLGINAAHQEWQKIKNNFNYNKLSFAYHDLESIIMLKKGYKLYKFYFEDSDGNAVSSKEMNIKIVDNGNELNYLKRTKTNGTISIVIPNNATYEIASIDYYISNISNPVSNQNVKDVTVTLGVAKTTYTAEIYIKYWNEDSSKFSSLKNTSVTVISLDTSKSSTKTTHSSDGFITSTLNHGEYYKIIINDGKNYEINALTENSNTPYFKFEQADGTYIVPKIYLREIN